MTAFFFDSSALVKRYITEVGSDWVQEITTPRQRNQLIIARVTWVEVLSAFARLRREVKLTADGVEVVLQTFRYDIDTQYQLVEFDEWVAEQAGQLVQKYPLRAYDSVQLASALKLKPIFTQFPTVDFVFVAADHRLLDTARSEGLTIDNPNDH